ncbi:TetR/AcrR family transcriptional regulator [Cupriavidus necator]
MPRIYRRATAAGFGNDAPAASEPKPPAAPRSKPLKRPSQQRAHFTVNAIYDAFVRIWRRHGWEGVTTRAVALEAGFSVGTLYEYFPSKEALVSGYVRHTVESLLARIDAEVTQQSDADWRTRVRRLVAIACGADDDAAGIVFDAGIIGLEPRIAEPKHHRRVFEEFCAAWQRALSACPDLPRAPDDATVQALVLAVWGARRYRILLQDAALEPQQWVRQMQALCLAALATQGDEAGAGGD